MLPVTSNGYNTVRHACRNISNVIKTCAGYCSVAIITRTEACIQQLSHGSSAGDKEEKYDVATTNKFLHSSRKSAAALTRESDAGVAKSGLAK